MSQYKNKSCLYPGRLNLLSLILLFNSLIQCFPNWGPRTPGVPRGSARGSAEKRTIKKIPVEFKKKCVNDCAQPFLKNLPLKNHDYCTYLSTPDYYINIMMSSQYV